MEEELGVQASIALRGEPKERSEKSNMGRKAAAVLSGGHSGGKTGKKTLKVCARTILLPK